MVPIPYTSALFLVLVVLSEHTIAFEIFTLSRYEALSLSASRVSCFWRLLPLLLCPCFTTTFVP